MENEEILLAAIKKAEKNGWTKNPIATRVSPYPPTDYTLNYECLECYDVSIHINQILFDKEFWKALVGERLHYNTGLFKYEYHIQQIALEDDRIKYLKSFI